MGTLPKTYQYKVYRSGVYLGDLPNVISDFKLSQLINTAGTQLDIEIQLDPDTTNQANEPIQTETGDTITDESGVDLLIERQPDVFGNSASNILLREENDLVVWMFNDNYPNGKQVFEGYITTWKANFGHSNIVHAIAVNYGTELDNVVIEGGINAVVSQTAQDGYASLYDSTSSGTLNWFLIGQTFTVPAGVTNISSVIVRLAAESTTKIVSLKLRRGFPSVFTSRIAIQTIYISSTTPADYTFTFPSPVDCTPGELLSFTLDTDDSPNNVRAYHQDSDVYAGGTHVTSICISNTIYDYVPDASYDMYFKIQTTTGATSSPYNSEDPGQIVRDIMDINISKGGLVDYTTATVDLAGYTASYTFKVNTILEGIKKMLELSPADFYWYVDPAINRLYFKEQATTAAHTLILGKHIEDLNLEYTIENIKNIVYFSGGDIGGGINLFAKFTNTASLNNHRIGLDRISDNRVTQLASAGLLAEDVLDANDTGVYRTTVTILEGTYDIESFNLGQNITFKGFGNFIDNLLLQIVGIDRNPDSATLSLGTNPPRATKTVEALKRQLTDVQTIDNPSVPE